MTYVVILVCLLMSGCASRYGYAPAPNVLNLGGYVANDKAVLWLDAQGCHLVVRFADGLALPLTPSDDVCRNAQVWVKAQAAVPTPAAVPAARPDDAK